MKKILLAVLTATCICGCSHTASITDSSVDAIIGRIDDGQKSLGNMEKNLSPECKTAVIASEIDAQKRNYVLLRTESQNVKVACTAEKTRLESIIDKWKTIAYSCMAIIVGLGLTLIRK
jgi:hypothetical protein